MSSEGVVDHAASRGYSPVRWLITGWQALKALDRFVRLHFLCFSTWLVLLGAASASSSPSGAMLVGLLAVAVSFHVFAYVLNDVIDLPVDRTQPSRAADPLITGAMRPWQALAVALVQVPLSLALAVWLGAGPAGAGVLLLGFVLMAVYNLWGKRCFLPPLTDAAQGIAWGCLAVFGSIVVGGMPSAGAQLMLTAVAFASGAGFILLINGVHGGLRDLDNDFAAGMKTTSIYFGARRDDEVGIRMPLGLKIFAWTVQLGLVAAVLLPMVFNTFDYPPATRWTIFAMAVFLSAINLRHMAWVFQPRDPRWVTRFKVHMFFLLLAPLVIFLPSMDAGFAALTVFCFLAPYIFFPVSRQLIRDGLARLSGNAS